MSKKTKISPPLPQRTIRRKVKRFPGVQLLGYIVVGVIIILATGVPLVHKHFCNEDPGNPREAVKAATAAVMDALDMTAVLMISTKKFVDQQYDNDPNSLRYFDIQMRFDPINDPFTKFAPAQDREVQTIFFNYFEGYDLLGLQYVYDSLSTEKESRSMVMMRFRPSSDGEQNLSYLSSFIRKFVEANEKHFPQLDADSIISEMRLNAYWHLDHLRESWITWIRIGLGLTIVLNGLLMYMPVLVWACRQARRKYRQNRVRGYPITSPSLIACLVAGDASVYLEIYSRHIGRQRREFAEKMAKVLREQEYRRGREEHEQMLRLQLERAIQTISEELNGVNHIPEDVQERLDVAVTETIRTKKRLHAVEDALRLLGQHRTGKVHAQVELSEIDPEERLLLKTREIPIESLLPEQHERFHECMVHWGNLSKSPRIRLRLYWLERALYAASDEYRRELEAARAEKDLSPDTVLPRKRQISVVTTEDFAELLDIERHIPETVDYQHALAIILWGLLRPAQDKHAYFNKRYTPERVVVRIVMGKLKKAYNHDLYVVARDWLMRHGVIMNPKAHRHDASLTINLHKDAATKEGLPIIGCIVRFRGLLAEIVET